MIQLVWFKRDLRTVDHAPLAEAAAAGPVLPLYVVEPDYWALPDTSRRQFRAVRGALAELRERLAELGAPLVIRVGSVRETLADIHARVGIARVLAHEETGNAWTFARDKQVRRFCRETGIELVEKPQFGVVRRLRDRDGWGRAHAAFMAAPIVREPAHLRPVPNIEPGPLPDLPLPDDGCAEPQPGTGTAALDLLGSFFAGRGANYRRAMSSPLGDTACSRLSVPLSTGAISIREVFSRTYAERDGLTKMPPDVRPIPVTAADSLIARLHWHCHFIQKLESEPELEFRSLHPAHEAARVPTPPDDPVLEAWAAGRTGYPFVDACMRSLIATGWLNFRMRAMLQSFASYHLGLDWHASGTSLARLFTDYEPGIHWPQVQMQSGATGINTPRIYNPVKQGLDQDPQGIFTRRWVPELTDVPLAFLQEPWRLGTPYLPRLVEHAAAVRAARERLSAVRRTPGFRQDASAVFDRHGSRKRSMGQDDPAKTRAINAARAEKAARQLALDV
jgi:deoxyribodipyrimidine photo-lyase